LLYPIYQFASSPPSENLPKSFIFGVNAIYVGSIVLVETVDNAAAKEGIINIAIIIFTIIF
jgi:hypothetical protein